MAELSVEISAKIDRLLSELGKAKKALGGIGTATERLTEKLKKAGEKMGRIGKSMTTYLTLPLAAIAGASIKMASDFTESLNKVDVAFKSSSKEVRKFAETTLETFGIAEGTALDMAALFGDMATSMGVPTDKAADLSTAMVGLAGDLSSFKNINIKEVTTALNGVFTGETESLKRLGIVMTQTNLKQFALSKGMSDNLEVMTQAQKVQLRYAYILEKTKNAQGDFARTSDGSANQMRIFSESVKELSVAFGEILLPYFTKAITYVNKVVKAFVNLSPATKKIIVVVAGLVAAIAPLLIALGFLSTTIIPALITGFGILSSAVVFTGGVFKTLTTVMLANPIVLIAAGVAALVLGFTALIQKITPAVSKLKTFFNLIKSGGIYSRFVTLQMQDQASAMIEESKAAKIAAAELKKFNKQQEDAAIAAEKLTSNLLNQKNDVTIDNVITVSGDGKFYEEIKKDYKDSKDKIQEFIELNPITLADTSEWETIDWEAYYNLKDLDKINESLKERATLINESMDNLLVNSVANSLSNLGTAIGEGTANATQAIVGGMGSLLSAMGDKLIQLGTAAVLAGTITSLFGSIAGIGAGFAAIAGGIALKAIGTGMGKFAGAGGSSQENSSSGAGASNFSGSSGGGNFGASSGGMQNVVFEIQGTKLVGVLSNTLSRNRSLGGSLSLT